RTRVLREARRVGPRDRDVDERARRQRLRLAVLDDLEVVAAEVADEGALRVGHARVDLDVVDLDLERDGGLRRLWRLRGDLRQCREENDDSRYSHSSSAVGR